MGMTIEESIDRLEDLHFEQDNWEYGELTEDCLLNREALRLAINTMRKYKQIEEIVEDRNGKPPLTTLNKIVMVVEEWTYFKKKARENKDGKID